MADNKKEPGIIDTLSQWWASKSAPPPPSRIPAVDPRRGNRYQPSPKFSWVDEGFPNMWAELKRSHFGADYLRDLTKSAYSTAVKTMRNPPSFFEVADSINQFGDAIDQYFAGREFEKTGKWPQTDPDDLSSYRYRNPAWRKAATKTYLQMASLYSYVDPKTKKRITDWDAINRGMSNDPIGTIAPIFMGGAAYAGRVSSASEKLAALNRARGFTEAATVNQIIAKTAKAAQITGDVTARALNPAASVVAVSARPVTQAVRAATPIKVLDKEGNFLPKIEEMMRNEGFDPNLYSSPEARAHFQSVLSKSGITPAAIRKAVGTYEGIPVTRSMAAREYAPNEFRTEVESMRRQGQEAIERQMQEQFGRAPDERDLGASFVRSYTTAKSGVEKAYKQAFENEGVFTNADTFTSGVKDSINQELGAMGLDIDTIMTAPRFAQTQNALGGMRRGDRKFGGVFKQFDDLAGSTGAPVISAPDLSGEMHTFDVASKQWLNASGQPVTAPGKLQYLDQVSNRLNIPEMPSGQNGLTPRNIDGIRRDVNSFYTEAKTAEDKAALAAINRGIDNYIEQNSANFTGDGRRLATDLANARATNQAFIYNFDKSPNKVIRDASKITAAGLVPDEAGVLRFSGDPNSINAHLETRMLDPKTLQPKVNYTGANTVTGDAVFSDLYNILDDDGRNALFYHMRNTAATSPASPAAVTDFVNRTTFFSPEEKEMVVRFQNARGIATEPPMYPSTLNQGTGTRWGMRISAPLIGQSVGTTLGSPFGPAGSQLGGWLGTAAGSALEGKLEGVTRASRLQKELETLPKLPTTAPSIFTPLTAAVAGTGITGQSPLLQQPEQPQQPQPKAPPPVPLVQQPRDEYSLPTSVLPQMQPREQRSSDPYAVPADWAPKKEDPYAVPEDWRGAQPQYRGGRAAYQSGGAVNDIEPLIRNLVNKAGMVKKMSNKATEPLLNEHDNAIASALEVAQKSI